MRAPARLMLCILSSLAGCATSPQLVMVNPRSGMTVDCNVPDNQASSGEYLVSRACLSACQAHGFRPLPGVQAQAATDGIPTACMN